MDGDFISSNLSNLLLFAQQNELEYIKQKKAKWFYDFVIKLII